MKKIENRYILSFSKEELTDSNVKRIIRELINLKLNLQRYKDFITISPAEFEVLSKFTGEFVDKSKYNSKIMFKGEIGKIRGKRLVIQKDL